MSKNSIDKNEIKKAIREAIASKDYAALENLLAKSQQEKLFSQSTLRRVAEKAVRHDDVKALSLLLTYGFSIKKDMLGESSLMHYNSWNGDYPKITRFLYNLGYNFVNNQWYEDEQPRYYPPISSFIRKNHSLLKEIVDWALSEKYGYLGIAESLARTGNMKAISHLKEEQLLRIGAIKDSKIHLFEKSIEESNVEAAKFFANYNPDITKVTYTSGHTLLTNYKVEDKSHTNNDPEKTKAVISYLTKDLGYNINHQSYEGKSFLFKHNRHVKTDIYQSQQRLLPFYISCGLNIRKQLSGNKPYDRLRDFLYDFGFGEKENIYPTDNQTYTTLADLIYHDNQVPLHSLEKDMQIFGSYFKNYISEPGNREEANILLNNPDRFVANPAIASFIMRGKLNLFKPDYNIEVNKPGFKSFENKFSKLKNYMSEINDPATNKLKKKDRPRGVDTLRYNDHINDVLKQFTKNIIFPVAIKSYGLDVADKKIESVLVDKTCQVLFGDFKHDNKSYEAQSLDKVILMCNRYDIGVKYITGQLHSYDRYSEWPAAFEPMQAPNGKFIVPLTTSNQVKDAADTLSNCVYGSLDDIRKGNILLFNVTDDKDIYQNLPSLHLEKNGELTSGSAPLGLQNSSPDKATLQAWEWFQNEIEKPEYASNLNSFIEWRSKNSHKIESIPLVGFPLDENWKQNNQDVFTAWQRVWGGTDRYRWNKLTKVDDFIEQSGFSEVLSKFAEPSFS